MKEVQGVAGEKMANVTTRGTQKFVGAVENAISILRFLTHDYAASGVARIARETGINVSTTFNILRTLANEGLISMNPSTKLSSQPSSQPSKAPSCQPSAQPLSRPLCSTLE